MIATCRKCRFTFQTRQTSPGKCHAACKAGGVCEFTLTPSGLGDRLAGWLSAIGITKVRWSRWWAILYRRQDGEVAACGCGNRQERLNRWFPW